MAALVLCLALAGCRQDSVQPPPAKAAKPTLALLTSLPILFAESFGLDAPPNALLTALEQRYAVQPVDGPEQLAPMGLLLAMQPQAMTAERLVALDRWVREGGRLVLLADPRLEWESSRPLGDCFRPPYAFPDTGLLRRWGLVLEEPEERPEEPSAFDLGRGLSASGSVPGSVSSFTPHCMVAPGRAVVRCRIDRGSVTVVADADFVMLDEVPGNHEAVIALLDESVRRPSGR